MPLDAAPHPPSSTYRLQLRAEFGFAAAHDLMPYLHRLGIECVYASPVFRARPGSGHGYDVVDPTRLNAELGSAEGFRLLVDALHRQGMALLLDIVPNHMAVDSHNDWWMDVLQNGRASRYARFFDIDWAEDGRVLVPLLGAPLQTCIERGEIRVTLEPAGADEDGAPSLFAHYYQQRFPLHPGSWPVLLGEGAPAGPAALTRALENDEARAFADLRLEFASSPAPAGRALLADLLERQHYRLVEYGLPATRRAYRRFFAVNDLIGLRQEDDAVFEATHQLLFDLVGEGLVDGVRIDHVDGLRDPAAYLGRLRDRLDRLAGRRFYVVVEKILTADELLPEDWPVDGTTGYDFINVLEHAFFDPAGVARLDAFYRSHTGRTETFAELAFAAKRQVLTGMLGGDLEALSEGLAALPGAAESASPGSAAPLGAASVAVPGGRAAPTSRAESAPRATPDPRTEPAPRAGAQRPAPATAPASQVLRQALIAVTCALPAYRTYVRDFAPRPADRRLVRQAVSEASGPAGPAGAPAGSWQAAVGYLEGLLQLEADHPAVRAEPAAALDFVLRWQQLTSAVTAKGVEDTALYRYSRLLALSDVGTETEALARRGLHGRNLHVAHSWPATLSASTTHDTKRAEDARCRLDCLTEFADDWSRLVGVRATGAGRRPAESQGPPLSGDAAGVRPTAPPPGCGAAPRDHVLPSLSPEDELLVYQSLLGSWPAKMSTLAQAAGSDFRDRAVAFLVKAVREAKLCTGWEAPDEAYEDALAADVDYLLSLDGTDFGDRFLALQRDLAWHGMLASLARTLVKITSPGIPDFYQGTELWDLSFVDPDNRRPVDFDRHAHLLAALERGEADDPAELLEHWHDGRVKLHVMRAALHYRREHADLFASGSYQPLVSEGAKSKHVLAFSRRLDTRWAVTVVARRTASLQALATGGPRWSPGAQAAHQWPGREAWADTTVVLPREAPDAFRDVLTGVFVATASDDHGLRTLEIGSALASLPAALLAGEN